MKREVKSFVVGRIVCCYDERVLPYRTGGRKQVNVSPTIDHSKKPVPALLNSGSATTEFYIITIATATDQITFNCDR